MNNCNNNNLYLLSFVVGSESGLAMVSASSEAIAKQTLRNSGRYNWDPKSYNIIQCRNIGVTASIRTELLIESYVNALTAYEAIISSLNKYIGPKGDKGNQGDPGPMLFETVEVTIDDGVGEPSVDVTPFGTPGVDGMLRLDFHNLKGEQGVSVASVEQTRTSREDGGDNEVTVTLDSGQQSKIVIKNGKRGISSATAGIDTLPGTPSVVVDLSEEGLLSLFFSGIKGETGQPGRNNTSMSIVDELPEPSEDIMDKIFLLYNDLTDKYDVYFVETYGSTYSYVQAGSLEVNLEDYKRKDSEIWLTQEEFDAIPIKDATKTYNIYEEEDIETEIPDEEGGSGDGSSGSGSSSLSETA